MLPERGLGHDELRQPFVFYRRSVQAIFCLVNTPMPNWKASSDERSWRFSVYMRPWTLEKLADDIVFLVTQLNRAHWKECLKQVHVYSARCLLIFMSDCMANHIYNDEQRNPEDVRSGGDMDVSEINRDSNKEEGEGHIQKLSATVLRMSGKAHAKSTS